MIDRYGTITAAAAVAVDGWIRSLCAAAAVAVKPMLRCSAPLLLASTRKTVQ